MSQDPQDRELSDVPESAADVTMVKSSSIMAVGTVVSRITGIGRDIAMTAALGFFLVSDAFSLGNSLPTIVYILIIGGALNAVFIPQLVRHMKDDPDGGTAYANRLLTLTATALLAVSVIAVIAAPWIVDLYTPTDYPAAQLELATAFARLCLPQIFFYGLFTLFSQVLNSRGHFAAPMFAPIVNNVIAIAAFGLFLYIAGTSAAADGVLTTDQILILGIGSTLGVLGQALVLLPVLFRSGFHWKLRFDWRGAGLGKAGKLAAWTIGLVLVNQAAYVVITRLATQANVDASLAGTVAAGLTTYQKAHLVFMLPHSVITVSIVTALLPALSRVAHAGRLHDVGRDIGKTMRLVALLIIPISIVLAVLGPRVAVLLFGYGAATQDQAVVMGVIVSVFMIGLLPFTLFYVILRGFYALEDTKTPFWITVAFNVVLIALSVAFFNIAGTGGFQVAGIALGYSLAYWVALVVAWLIISKRLGGIDSATTLWAIVRMLIAAGLSVAAMFAVALTVFGGSAPTLTDDRITVAVSAVGIGAVGLVVFGIVAWILRIRELTLALDLIRAKVRR